MRLNIPHLGAKSAFEGGPNERILAQHDMENIGIIYVIATVIRSYHQPQFKFSPGVSSEYSRWPPCRRQNSSLSYKYSILSIFLISEKPALKSHFKIQDPPLSNVTVHDIRGSPLWKTRLSPQQAVLSRRSSLYARPRSPRFLQC